MASPWCRAPTLQGLRCDIRLHPASDNLPGALQRWRVGGNAYAQNRVQGSWGNDRSEQKGYALVGLQAGYRLTGQTDLRLVVDNPFDKRYYANVGWTSGGSVFGAPRNAVFTASHRF